MKQYRIKQHNVFLGGCYWEVGELLLPSDIQLTFPLRKYLNLKFGLILI